MCGHSLPLFQAQLEELQKVLRLTILLDQKINLHAPDPINISSETLKHFYYLISFWEIKNQFIKIDKSLQRVSCW